MECVNCGAELTGAAKFCTACGTAAPAAAKTAEAAPVAAAPVAERKPRKRKAPVWMVLLFVFLLIATAATAVFAWRAFRYDPSSRVAAVNDPEIERGVAPESPVEQPEVVSVPQAQMSGTPESMAAEEERLASTVAATAALTEPRVDPPGSTKKKPEVTEPPKLVEPTSVVETAPAPELLKVEEAGAVDAAPASPAEPAPPPPPKRSKKIMLGGSQAYDPPEAPKPSPQKVATAAPVVKKAPTRGDLYWTGELKKKQVITINGIDSTSGLPGGDFLPGAPVTVEVYSPAIRVIEEPSEANGWTKISFECLRSSKGSATINFRWNLR